MSGFTDLMSVIGRVAPLLASVLPIPGAGLIGQVVASAFGGDYSKPTELAQMIEKDPNAAVKLAEIEANMRMQLEQIASVNFQNKLLAEKARLDALTAQIESDRLDRASARELAKISYMPDIISFIVVIGFFAVICTIIFFPLNNTESNVLFLLFGAVSSAFASVVSYWLGSSASSKSKDVMLEHGAENLSFEKAKTQVQTETVSILAKTAQNTSETAKTAAEMAATTAQVVMNRRKDDPKE